MRWCLRLILLGFISVSSLQAEYNPLEVSGESITTKDLTVKDQNRQREIPLRVYLPAQKTVAPLLLFSHGLGGSRAGNSYLGNHWAGRGYVAVFLQHPGSDESIWKDLRPIQRLVALKKAANAKNWFLRVQDVPAVIDQLERWNTEKNHPLASRMDLKRIGMSGHSFGASTTQAVSGQQFRIRRKITDNRIKAAVAFSPSAPQRGDARQAFGSVSIPWMLMTGTHDTAVIGNATVENRLSVYPALSKGNKYHLVLDKAEHSAFSDRALPGDKQKLNPNHHRVILALTTAFWDAHLKSDQSARNWLDGQGPSSVLEKADRWEKK